MTLCEKLIDLRRKAGLSQEQMAQQLDVSRQAVSKWETGESLPDTNKLLAIGRLLGVTVDYLLDDEQTDPAPTSAGPRKSGFARFWRTYGFVSGYLMSLVGILGLARHSGCRLPAGRHRGLRIRRSPVAGGTQHKSDLHRSLLPVQTGADPVPDPGLPALRRPDGRRLPAGPVAPAEIPDRLIAPLPPKNREGRDFHVYDRFFHIFML